MMDTEPRTQKSEFRTAEVLRRSEELLAVLETDALHMQESLSILDRMRGLVIKHDESGLQEMLQQIRAKADAYAAAESQRQRLRRQLAVLLDCPLAELTLSRLTAALHPPLRDRAVRQRAILRDLAERLRREHRNTSLLLTDCVRFNLALFRAIFHQGKTQPVVYGATGMARPVPSSHLMNVQF
jgi:hypothetical protein